MNNKPYELIGSGAGIVLTAVQTQQVFQIISLVLTCLSITFSIAFTLYKWFKEAKKDGKIDKEEIDEAIDVVTKGVKEINNEIDKHNKEKGDN